MEINDTSDFEFQIVSGKSTDLNEIGGLWESTINWHAKLDKAFTLDKDGVFNFKVMITAA